MSKQNLQRLSALMDDELSPGRARPLLEAMEADGALRRFWESGQIIGAAMRGDELTGNPRDLATRVQQALQAEPVVLAPTRPARRRSLGPIGGLALAASVALVAIVATRQSLLQSETAAPGPLASTAPATAPKPVQAAAFDAAGSRTPAVEPARAPDSAVALTRMTWNDAGPGVEARLNAYLLNHNEYMVGGVRGMLPYARVVGYGQNK